MKWGRVLFLFAFGLGAASVQADELHLRDGSVIVGVYVGGTQKEVYFQRTPISPEIYPLIMVESVRFTSTSFAPPGASLQSAKPNPLASAAAPADTLATRLKWVLALFFPPHAAIQLTASTH